MMMSGKLKRVVGGVGFEFFTKLLTQPFSTYENEKGSFLLPQHANSREQKVITQAFSTYKKGSILLPHHANSGEQKVLTQHFSTYEKGSILLPHHADPREQKVLTQAFSTYKKGSIFLPQHIDWRGQNVLTPVKNQGNSGACVVFAVVSAVESVINCTLKPEDPIELSVQHVLNRFARKRLREKSKLSGGNIRIEDVFEDGCTIQEVLRSIRDNGIPTEKAFKYTGVPVVSNANDWKTIPIPDFRGKYYIEDYKLIRNDEFKIREALFKHPVIASVDSTSWSWKHVKEDKVYWGPPVPYYLKNHAVLLVGCGVHKGTRYWIVRDTQGIDFGDGGYIKIVRGKNCFGIESEIWVPIIDLDTLCF